MTNSSNGEGIFKDLLETLLHNSYTPIEWEGYTPYNKLSPRPPLERHKRVVIAQAILERYVGRYVIPPNVTLTIHREGDHLSIQENDEPKQDLLPESEIDFYSSASDDTCTFQLDSQGKVAALILHADGKDLPVKRVD